MATPLRILGAVLAVAGAIFWLLPLGDPAFGQLLDGSTAALTAVAGVAVFALGTALGRQRPQ